MVSGLVAVLGGGAWGTALANCLATTGQQVCLWGRDELQMSEIAVSRRNSRHLPGIALAEAITPTSDLADIRAARVVLIAVPTQAIRAVGALAAPFIRAGVPVVACAKGVEIGTGSFVCEVLAESVVKSPIGILSGPSFAADVARGLPTAVTLAAADPALAARLAHGLSSRTFRVYSSSDVRGVEIGGATKNVLAIACGIASGAGLGASANAALIARGFAELIRIGVHYGAKPETLTGLSGLGDLVLTCTSSQSRNFSFGHALGEGVPLESVMRHGTLVEGAYTAQILVEAAKRNRIDMPICEGVAEILAGRVSAKDAIASLMARPPRPEM